MRRFLRKIGVLSFLSIAFILAYGTFCDQFFSDEAYFDKDYKPAWVLSQNSLEVDFAVLGSSRAFSAFDMNLMEKITGKSWINLGANGSGLAENFMALHLFLKRNKVGTVLIQIDVEVLVGAAHEKNKIHPYSFLPYWTDSVVRSVLVREIEPLSSPVLRLTPQLRYFYFNKYFSPKEIVRRLMIGGNSGEALSRLLGAEPLDQRSLSSGGGVKKENRAVITDYTINPYLSKILELTRENDVEVVFFTAPIYFGKLDEVVSFGQETGYEVLLPDIRLQQDESLFSDTSHLNEKGRRIYTLHLAECIQSVISTQ